MSKLNSAYLKAALVAGLLAGASAGIIHILFTEPIVEQALQLEEQAKGTAEEPVVSREGQIAGLLAGSAIIGVATSLIFGLIYSSTHRWLPGAASFTKSLALGALAYVAVFLFPFLKYPANPPGVGQTETIFYRQSLYVWFQILSAAVVLVGFLIYFKLRRRRSDALSGLSASVISLSIFFLIYLLMPGNPDPVNAPIELIQSFRAVSFLGQSAMWLILILIFGKLCQRWVNATVTQPSTKEITSTK